MTLAHDFDLSRLGAVTRAQVLHALLFLKVDDIRNVYERRSGVAGFAARRQALVDRLVLYVNWRCPDDPALDAAGAVRLLETLGGPRFGAIAKYSLWAQIVPDAWWTFMNYGLWDPDAEVGSLVGIERHWRYAVTMYDKVGRQTPLAGRDVLEVGSGRGGGAAYLARAHRPRSMTGLDGTASNVAFCRRAHRRARLRFEHGAAERLPFDDQSFDVVLNVESCFYYQPLSAFARGVARVLRPGGRFVVAHFGPVARLLEARAVFLGAGLHLLREEDLSFRVRIAIERFVAEDLWPLLAAVDPSLPRATVAELLRHIYSMPALLTQQAPYVLLVLEKAASSGRPRLRRTR